MTVLTSGSIWWPAVWDVVEIWSGEQCCCKKDFQTLEDSSGTWPDTWRTHKPIPRKIQWNYFKINIVKLAKSNYRVDLKFGLVWILNGLKEIGLQKVQILNGIRNPEAQPLEIHTNGHHFVKNHLKSGQNCPDFEWTSFQMVETLAMVIYLTLWKSDHLKSNLQKVRISNG